MTKCSAPLGDTLLRPNKPIVKWRTRLRGPDSPLKVIVWKSKCYVDKFALWFSWPLIPLDTALWNPKELCSGQLTYLNTPPRLQSMSVSLGRGHKTQVEATLEDCGKSTGEEHDLQAHTG